HRPAGVVANPPCGPRLPCVSLAPRSLLPPLLGRMPPMRLFLSAGEPSGDLHGASLLRALRDRRPDVQALGFGGPRLPEAGCELPYPLCALALVGVLPVLASVPKFWSILNLAKRAFRERRPDALVLIDYPGFHWWLAGAARQLGIPVVYYVPPQ